MSKEIIFGVFICVLINSLLADEINLIISTKNSGFVAEYLRRFFPSDKRTMSPSLTANENVDKKGIEESRKPHHSKHCHVCISVVDQLEKYLNHSKSAEDVQRVLLGTCDILKNRRRGLCIEFYKGIGLDIIKDLLKKVDAKQICQKLHICRKRIEAVEEDDVLMDVHAVLSKVARRGHECKHCLKMTKHLERVLNSSNSADFVVKRLSAMCIVYQSTYQSNCNRYFKNATVVDYYKSVLAHECVWKICSKQGRCHHREEHRVPEVAVSPERNPSGKCKLCVGIVALYEYYINRSEKLANIQTVFIGLCDILKPPLRTACIKFFKGPGLDVIKDILKGVDPQKICQNLHFCRSRSEFSMFDEVLKYMEWISPMHPKIHACKDCQRQVVILERVLNSNQSVNSLFHKMATVCTIFKDKYQNGCLAYYKMPPVIQFFTSVLAHKCPFKVCQDAGACHRKEEDLRLEEVEQESPSLCKVCQQVTYLYGRLTKNKRTMGTLIAVSEKVCMFLPRRYHTQCVQFVDHHRNEILDKFLKGVTVGSVCTEMKVCSVTEKSMRGATTIATCEIVVPVVFELIDDKEKDEKNVKSVLHNVCDKLPAFLQKDCHQLMKLYGTKIGDYIVEGVSRERICDNLEALRPQKVDTKRNELKVQSIQCEVCKDVMEQLSHMINKKSTKEDIEKALNQVCSKVKWLIKDLCENLVHQFVDQIVNYLISGIAPTQICDSIGLCVAKEIRKDDTLYYVPSDMALG